MNNIKSYGEYVALMDQALNGFDYPGAEDHYYACALEALDNALWSGEVDGRGYKVLKDDLNYRYYETVLGPTWNGGKCNG